SRFPAGALSLVSGVAELAFDSGTNVLMEGPCELQVISADTAQLLAGNVVVHVTELSDGFTLRTPDATILDEGTEYAGSLDDDATEVHVFDGSVFWEPSSVADEEDIQRITAGEARRYLRSKPGKGQRIPLKKVRFIRRIESDVRDSADAGLLGYDGFENLAGRVQRGRSGFGWSGGWKAGYRGHGEMGTIVEAPDDTVFGMPRSRRRLLRLAHGQVMRRDLEQPVPLDPGETYYASFLVQRHPGEADSGRFLQVSLYSDDEHPGRRSRNELAIGITSDGFPFVKSGGRITQSAPAIEDDAVYLFVAKFIASHEQNTQTCLRVYREGELIEQHEPSAWTAVGLPGQCESSLSRVRLTAGDNALF
ncbi:MAG: FecR domain-containing protein, partial [Patescibacteria group bacterium]|nr:FecR domain-containing protein [Patescibacteria group bacterium]